MTLITLPINTQAYELVREQIAIILATEIDKQGTLSYDPRLLGMKVFIEAINPEDKTELPLINVSFAQGSYGNNKAYNGTNQGKYIYNIDVYTNSKQTVVSRGDNISALFLQQLLGLCRVILDHPVYTSLGFARGFIVSCATREINIKDEGKNDAMNSRMGRLTFEVNAVETDLLPAGILLTGADTTVMMNETEEGYFYSVN